MHALKLNEVEARAAVGGDTLDHVRRLGVPEVLFSRGHAGRAGDPAGRARHVPRRETRFSDPTGAGDSLSALYCLARTRGAEPEEAIRFAVEQVERLYTA